MEKAPFLNKYCHLITYKFWYRFNKFRIIHIFPINILIISCLKILKNINFELFNLASYYNLLSLYAQVFPLLY